MKKFIEDINTREGKGSSSKFWYNISCLTATIIVLWCCYRDTLDDFYFVMLVLCYLITVGGFLIILDIVRLIVQLKGGSNANSTTAPKLETDRPDSGCSCPSCPAVVVPDPQPEKN